MKLEKKKSTRTDLASSTARMQCDFFQVATDRLQIPERYIKSCSVPIPVNHRRLCGRFVLDSSETQFTSFHLAPDGFAGSENPRHHTWTMADKGALD